MSTIDKAIDQAASGVSAAATSFNASYGDILKHYMVAALEKTGNLVDKSVDLVMEQAPILIQEVLHWYFAYNLILFIIGIALLGFQFYVIRKTHLYLKAEGEKPASYGGTRGYDEFMWAPIGLILVIYNLIVFASCINLTWLKIWIAPRLWLIEYTAELVKHGVK